MSQVQLMTGNAAAALGAKLSQVQVVAAYPITPQSAVTETLARYIESRELDAEYVRVESEHSALTVCISAATLGARVFTSTSSQGLLYMHEQLHWAAGSRLPIVMACANRGVGAPWTIQNDQQDSVSQRDTGWVQIYCRNNQEILDAIIQGYRIAEQAYVPVMICYDGFLLSHTVMPVAIPEADQLAAFLPPYRPHTILAPDRPMNINPVVLPEQRRNPEGTLCDGYMELRCKLQKALEDTGALFTAVRQEFIRIFDRDPGGMLHSDQTERAEVILTGMGSITQEALVAAETLRGQGISAGVTAIRVWRPFPKEEIRKAFAKIKALVIFEKAISYGYEGPLCSEIKAALYESDCRFPIYHFIAGLGGRDVKARELVRATVEALAKGKPEPQPIWLNCASRRQEDGKHI